MTSIGLHITKCAGTTLMSSMRRLLTEDQYVLISSFYENIVSSRADIWDVVEFKRIKFVFGHYVHEDLLELFSPGAIWALYLFTGVREPCSRAISQYYQLYKVTGSAPDIPSFIQGYGSSMCDEIIRAFPSLANQVLDSPKWLCAAAILTAFDYIYSTEQYAETIGPVFDSIGLAAPAVDSLAARDNVRITDLDSRVVAHVTSAMETSDDTLLYSLIKPAIGQKGAGQIIANDLGIPLKRNELLASACQRHESSPKSFNYEFLYDLMGYELHLLGQEKKDKVLNILERRSRHSDDLIRFLRKRVYGS